MDAAPAAFALLAFCALADTPAQNDFQARIAAYIKVRNGVRPEKLKPTDSPEKIQHHEHEFAERIRKARPDAAQGDIFTPAISAEFRRLIAQTMQGPDAGRIRASLARAAPVRLENLRVNRTYPSAVPLQSTPPSLLMNLPHLPPELDYRVVDHALVLRDTTANLIIDFVPDAIP